MAIVASATMSDLIAAGLLLVVAVGGPVAAWWFFRRWWRRRDASDEDAGELTLQQLRELSARGQITDEEFRRLKDGLIRRMRAGDANDPGR